MSNWKYNDHMQKYFNLHYLKVLQIRQRENELFYVECIDSQNLKFDMFFDKNIEICQDWLHQFMSEQ